MAVNELEDKRIFDFIITVPGVVDKEGDVVPFQEIEPALDKWILNGGAINDHHTNRVVGKVMRFWKDDGNKYVGRGIINDGTWQDEVWQKIKKGEYKSVSIGGAAFKKTPNQHGGFDLNGLEIMEVSVCPDGMHQDANILWKNDIAKTFTPFFQKASITLNEKLSKASEEVLKPGASIHTEAWDRCIEHVKNTNPSANAYAVCTASLGGSSFKSKSDQDLVSSLKKENFEVNKMSNASVEVKKPDTDAFQMIMAKLDQLLQAMQGQGSVGNNQQPMMAASYGGQVEKKVGGAEDGGVKPMDVVSRVSDADSSTTPFGVPGKQPADGVNFLSNKALIEQEVKKALEEFKKSLNSSETPAPSVDIKSAGVEKAQRKGKGLTADAAYRVAKGKAKVEDFFDNSETAELERELAARRAFEDINGGAL